MSRERKKHWSKILNPDGGRRIRVYERENTDVLYYSVVAPDGRKVRRSLETSDRDEAERRAEAIAKELARSPEKITPGRDITFGDVKRAYLAHRGPQLSDKRLRYINTVLALFARFLEPGGRSFRLDDFGKHQADGYLAARRSGDLQPDDRRATDSPRDGTLANELQALSTVCNWATSYKVGGVRLLAHNPVKDVDLPKERNPKRPVASQERYEELLRVSGQVDEEGAFRAMLVVAWHTGRRINAICKLRASDVLLTRDQVRRAVAAAGMDEGAAEAWPHAIRWRAEHDKSGYETISPIGSTVVRELQGYLNGNPCVGEAWMFTMATDADRPKTKLQAGYFLKRAEKLAKLPKLRRGGWHAFRRAWATRRKHLPVQDVMAAGGWRDPKALQAAYQGADPETTRKVVELSETG